MQQKCNNKYYAVHQSEECYRSIAVRHVPRSSPLKNFNMNKRIFYICCLFLTVVTQTGCDKKGADANPSVDRPAKPAAVTPRPHIVLALVKTSGT